MIIFGDRAWSLILKIPKLNAMLKDYAENNGFIYLDYFTAMADDKNGLPKELADDGVHPTKEGYNIMKVLAEEAIKKALSNFVQRQFSQSDLFFVFRNMDWLTLQNFADGHQWKINRKSVYKIDYYAMTYQRFLLSLFGPASLILTEN